MRPYGQKRTGYGDHGKFGRAVSERPVPEDRHPYRTSPTTERWYVATNVSCSCGGPPFAEMHAAFDAPDADGAIQDHVALLEKQGFKVLTSTAERA